MRRSPALVLLVTTLGLAGAAASGAACGDDPLADGTLQVTVYGEDYIEDRIPAADVADGWSIDFQRFLVAVSDVSVGKTGKTAALVAVEPRVFDLTKPSNGQGHLLGSADVKGGVYDHASYSIAPAVQGSIAGNVTAADTSFMVDHGYAVYIEATAQKGGESKHFTWAFTGTTHYTSCPTAARVDGDTATAQITVHADHLFATTIGDEAAPLRFQALADADADHDDEVTQAELAAVAISGLSGYDVAGHTGVTDLGAFVAAQIPAIGHIDGEGMCESSP
ncbi:MAG: hypothetical protein U1F43_04350 [Myxococcota bacterium]